MNYSQLITSINDQLTVLEALVAALPDPVGDLQVIDTRIKALAGALAPKVEPPTTPQP